MGQLSVRFEQVALRKKQLQIATGQRESPETVEISGLFGCGERTRTSDLRVMSPTSYQLLYPAMLSCARFSVLPRE